MDIQSLQVGSIGTNCYLLRDENAKECAIIDPGGNADAVAAAAESGGCRPVCVLLTHGHYDHTDGVAGLRAKYPGLPVYLNPGDVYADGGREAARLFPALGETTPYGEGDAVTVGGLTVSVMSTPGHSKGSVTLLCGNVMFSGDTLFAGSCGRMDLLDGDEREMMRSLRRLGNLEGDFRVLPGHMHASLLSQERMYNPYLQQAMRSAE